MAAVQWTVTIPDAIIHSYIFQESGVFIKQLIRNGVNDMKMLPAGMAGIAGRGFKKCICRQCRSQLKYEPFDGIRPGYPVSTCPYCGTVNYDRYCYDPATYSPQTLYDLGFMRKPYFFTGFILFMAVFLPFCFLNVPPAFLPAALALPFGGWFIHEKRYRKYFEDGRFADEVGKYTGHMKDNEEYARIVTSLQGVEEGSGWERHENGSIYEENAAWLSGNIKPHRLFKGGPGTLFSSRLFLYFLRFVAACSAFSILNTVIAAAASGKQINAPVMVAYIMSLAVFLILCRLVRRHQAERAAFSETAETGPEQPEEIIRLKEDAEVCSMVEIMGIRTDGPVDETMASQRKSVLMNAVTAGMAFGFFIMVSDCVRDFRLAAQDETAGLSLQGDLFSAEFFAFLILLMLRPWLHLIVRGLKRSGQV
jgi:hypothetical protein